MFLLPRGSIAKARKQSHIIINEAKAGDVIIQNGHHFAVIDTLLVRTHIDKDETYVSGLMQNATETMEKYLGEHGHNSKTVLGMNKGIEYKEGVLEEHETIAVVGKAEWVNKNSFAFDLPREQVLLITAVEKNSPVYFTDDKEITPL